MADTSLLAIFLSLLGISNSEAFGKRSAADVHVFSFFARLKAAAVVAKATGVGNSKSTYDTVK
eukprot:scaffold37851_cov20-Prasinocladus_malaysianus.AAC.1